MYRPPRPAAAAPSRRSRILAPAPLPRPAAVAPAPLVATAEETGFPLPTLPLSQFVPNSMDPDAYHQEDLLNGGQLTWMITAMVLWIQGITLTSC
ncbi:hypothetical protein C2845_PM07G14930 [Panicum miliaceum]|uniref:Uncharacterized protein n=1 Tax=Panicum miliaceum TaxID=4540 RepID=A0A3L6SPN2_PANMI|nr:hypothetical protein C2845_PM07G14930 [Panicum miliaceum]